MKSKPKKQEPLSRPKEISLEEYKTWIREITQRLTTQKTEIKWTEEEWIENWKAYLNEYAGGQSK